MGRVGFLIGVAALALGGCGPSLRRVQDSRVYFERCYAGDFDARIPLAEKHACWTAWLEHYAAGQPPERGRYARERLYAVEHGESVPLLPEAAIGQETVAAVTVGSEEIEPVAELAATVDEEDIDRPMPRAERRASPMPRNSNPSCAARACETPWRECTERCPEEGESCVAACEVELQACARGCF